MKSKFITAKVGDTVSYKIIKDGYKTVSENILITSDTPEKNEYDLIPSSEKYELNTTYDVLFSDGHAPILEFKDNVITPDGTVIPEKRYILDSCENEYVIIDDNKQDNFTRVGAVKIHPNGYAFNFSANNYLRTPKIFFGTDDYEIVLKVKINNWSTENQCIFHSNSNYYFNVAITKNKRVHSNSGYPNTWATSFEGTTILELGKEYLIKTIRKDGTRSMHISSDNGETWTNEGSINDPHDYSVEYRIGSATGSNVFNGIVYLDDCYVKIKDESPVYLTRNKILNNVNVYGTMSLKNGVTKSVFSNTNYLDTIPKDFTKDVASFDTWEWVFKIEKFVHSSSIQMIYAQGRSYESGLHINTNDTLYVLLNNTSSNDYFGKLYGTTVLQEGRAYWIKVEFTGDAYKIWLSEDGTSWNLDASLTTFTKMTYTSSDNWHIGWNYHSNSSYHYPVQCELNISESYIKTNGKYWWRGVGLEVSNYGTIQGSVNIDSNYIASNFSGSNKIVTPVPSSTITSYEIVMRFKTDSFNDGRLIGNSGSNVYSPQLEVPASTSAGIWYGHPSSSHSWQAIESKTLPTLNEWWWVKLVYSAEESKLTMYVRRDNEEWHEEGSIKATGCGWSQSAHIGCDINTAAISKTTCIDLRNTYIKINDIDYWTPVVEQEHEVLKGIFDPKIENTGIAQSFNIYDIETKNRGLVLNKDRNFGIEDYKFAEYISSIDLPEYHPFIYNPYSLTWESRISTQLVIEDEDVEIYLNTNE